jgi:hypothetical protein
MEPERVQEEKWHLLINIFFSTVKFLAYFYLDPDSAKPGRFQQNLDPYPASVI